ncbi:saccharopine dehydrogenase family protein [Marivirga harenae]|uniref:saccharopine dehydrogenase family protein n=1 Tax=Marivirga harenae TaxID=2010992 RepID=UPI0026DFF047|nr:saccharopine dehydrogenase NADP-binding domain-containing protein [Marivirga harenae]WKV10778.1 saccharopine dehydrogenase NADP-binding domain-containing protein [Marivirga harenae]
MNYKILIYGANGYTGKLITQEAKNAGVYVELAGRNKKAIETLSLDTGLPYHICELNDKSKLEELLKEFHTVIHCAGPFSETAIPMVEACLKSKTNYLDITGEIWVFEDIMKYHKEAEQAGITLIPGVGFDVVPTDCLAGYLKEKMPTASSLELAFVGSKTGMSRGTAVTMAKNVSKGGFIRENGLIKNVPLAYEVKEFKFSHRYQTCMTIPWGDLMTSYHQTEIPTIKVFSGASPKIISKIRKFKTLKFLLGITWIQKIVRRKIENSVSGPNKEELEKGKTYIYGTVADKDGSSFSAELITPEAYFLTAKTALASALKLENTKLKGYLTPAQAFGNDFIMEFDNVERINRS